MRLARFPRLRSVPPRRAAGNIPRSVRSERPKARRDGGSAIIGRKIERATKKERADQEGPRGEPRLARAEVHEGCAAETGHGMDELDLRGEPEIPRDRKSTRLNSSH